MAGMVLFKQLLEFRISVVVLYLSAMVYSVSLVLTTIWIQPAGGWQIAAGTNWVALGLAVKVSVSVADSLVLTMTGVSVGNSIEVAMIGGNGLGVGCSGAFVSESESEIPPMTNRSEITAMMSPPPI